MTTTAAGTRVPPPLLYVAGYASGAIIQAALPIRIPAHSTSTWIGVALGAAGLGTVAASIRELHRSGTTVTPNGSVTNLVTTGPYRLSRNPIYLGFALAYAGIAIHLRTGWALVLLPGVIAAVDRAVIAREENYLEQTFPAEFRDYRARTGRWF